MFFLHLTQLDTILVSLHHAYTHHLRDFLADKTAMEIVLSRTLLSPSTSFPTSAFRRKRFPTLSDMDISLLLSSKDQLDSDGQWKLDSCLPLPFLLPNSLCVIRPALLRKPGKNKLRGLRVRQVGTLSDDDKPMFRAEMEDVGDLIAKLVGQEPGDQDLWELCWGYQVLVGE